MLSSTNSMNKKMAFSQRYSFRAQWKHRRKQKDGTVKKRGSQGSKQEARGLLGPGKRFIMGVFFVFSFSRGTFLGPRVHWRSKLIPRRAFPPKSSVLQVN